MSVIAKDLQKHWRLKSFKKWQIAPVADVNKFYLDAKKMFCCFKSWCWQNRH